MTATLTTTQTLTIELEWLDTAGARFVKVLKRDKKPFEQAWPVSYTHLTLPTSDLV